MHSHFSWQFRANCCSYETFPELQEPPYVDMSRPVKPSSCSAASRSDDLMLVLLHHDHSWRKILTNRHTEKHMLCLKPRHYAPLTPRFQAGAAVVCWSIWQYSLGLQHFGASVSAWFKRLHIPLGMLKTLLTEPDCFSANFSSSKNYLWINLCVSENNHMHIAVQGFNRNFVRLLLHAMIYSCAFSFRMCGPLQQ